jgi:hypothetical protein
MGLDRSKVATGIDAYVGAVEPRKAESRRCFDALQSSILDKAFKGEL